MVSQPRYRCVVGLGATRDILEINLLLERLPSATAAGCLRPTRGRNKAYSRRSLTGDVASQRLPVQQLDIVGLGLGGRAWQQVIRQPCLVGILRMGRAC